MVKENPNEKLANERISIMEAIVKILNIDIHKVSIQNKDFLTYMWLEKGGKSNYIARFFQTPWYTLIYINKRTLSPLKFDKRTAEAIVNYIREKSKTDRELRIYIETAEDKKPSLILNDCLDVH